MMPLRYPAALLAGLLAAAFLLWLMQMLVTPRQQRLSADDSTGLIEFVRLRREEQLQLKDRRPPPPPRQAKPLPRPRMAFSNDIRQPVPQLDMQVDLNLPLEFGDGPFLGAPSTQLDRDFMPLSRQPPRYPYQAERRGIEGWVRVTFRITETGTVEDVKVLESDPPGIFDQAAVNAVYRWRFKPRISNGQAVAGRAEQVVDFKLRD
ncbi:MAG TPA: energy transducer TonB [Gammaproteobacteria bacterium]|nr:energy transducer TonB [Gammaproteobacteria bacterium]